VTPGRRGLRGKLGPESDGDSLRDLILYGENIIHLPVISFRPDMKSVFNIDQLGCDAEFVALFSYAAFQHGLHI
jgi:hypothetical protein